jgi:hypothetical protein
MGFKEYRKQLDEATTTVKDMAERILIVAENEGDAYKKNDIRMAINAGVKAEREMFEEELNEARKIAEMELKKSWHKLLGK